MTRTRLLTAACGILALAGCGTPQSSSKSETTPPADVTAASSPKPAAEATPSASESVSTSPPPSNTPETPPITEASPSRARATATERLADTEVKTLLESIESKRAAFEAALDEKLKNTTIKGARGEVKTNEFFDDLQDQVKRANGRFSAKYSASSEVLSLLQYSARLDAWASTQPAGFQGSREWSALATDVRRLATVYNAPLLSSRQEPGGQARRVNDAELVTAVANIVKNMDAFRNAYDSALAANASLAAESRQAAIQNVDAMTSSARALQGALGNNQKGIAEANALLKGSAVMANATLKLPPNSAAAAAWVPVREDLSKVALAYEITPVR